MDTTEVQQQEIGVKKPRAKMIDPRYASFVEEVATLSMLSDERVPRQRKDFVLKNLTDSELLAVMEVIHNFLQGHIDVTDAELKKFERHEAMMCKFMHSSSEPANPAKDRKTRIKILRSQLEEQEGGFLPIIGLVARFVLPTVIGAVAKKLFHKRK